MCRIPRRRNLIIHKIYTSWEQIEICECKQSFLTCRWYSSTYTLFLILVQREEYENSQFLAAIQVTRVRTGAIKTAKKIKKTSWEHFLNYKDHLQPRIDNFMMSQNKCFGKIFFLVRLFPTLNVRPVFISLGKK